MPAEATSGRGQRVPCEVDAGRTAQSVVHIEATLSGEETHFYDRQAREAQSSFVTASWCFMLGRAGPGVGSEAGISVRKGLAGLTPSTSGSALGVSDALMNEALWVLTFPGDKRIDPIQERVAPGADWRARCERQKQNES